MHRRPQAAMAEPWSEPRDHGRASAAHLRKVLAGGTLQAEDDPVTTSERAVGVRRVGLPRQRAATGTAAAARTARAGRGCASRIDELVRLHDVHADAREISDRETAARPVRAGHDSTVGRDADGRPAAARAGENSEPECNGKNRLGGGGYRGGG